MLMLVWASSFIVRGICHARGDPHYKTFDGSFYDFMGMCEYVLARDTNGVFEIRQVNEPCGNGLVACTQSLSLIIPGYIVILERNRVKVNGSTISLPANYTGKNNCVLAIPKILHAILENY